MASFQRSLAEKPGVAELWLGLAFAQLQAGVPGEAKSSAQRAQALDGKLRDVGKVLQHAEAALRTGNASQEFLSRAALTWPQLMEHAVTRQKLRTSLHERAALHRLERERRRLLERPVWCVDKQGKPAHTDQKGESAQSSANDSASWSVRPPWPDEMPRIQAQFAPALRQTRATRHSIWVLAAEATERLAGVIVLSGVEDAGAKTVGDGPAARADLDLREAWIETPAGDALLDVVIRHAATIGLVSLDLQARLSAPMNALLQRHGFKEVIRHEVWTASMPDAIASQHAEYGRILKRWPVPIEPFCPTHLEAARQICAGTGLLAPEKVVLKSLRHPRGIDPATSFVAGSADHPIAILLSGIDGSTAEIEIVARNPATLMTAPAAVPALLLRFLFAAQNLGCREVRCSMRPEVTPSLITLMKKWNGR
ncbi:MAG TPA: hypothetical protein VEA63_13860, partial [Opitutus sp.]|nr:hypothetical protein [Opitutus sp.]